MIEWIEWSGGKQPLPDNTLVEVKLKNGMQYEEYSDEIRWSSRNDRDVATYRVIPEPQLANTQTL